MKQLKLYQNFKNQNSLHNKMMFLYWTVMSAYDTHLRITKHTEPQIRWLSQQAIFETIDPQQASFIHQDLISFSLAHYNFCLYGKSCFPLNLLATLCNYILHSPIWHGIAKMWFKSKNLICFLWTMGICKL